jgi:hypothetical protein
MQRNRIGTCELSRLAARYCMRRTSTLGWTGKVYMRRSGFFFLTLASLTGWSGPTDAHDIYMALKNRFGQSCCNEGDCRPAHYRIANGGVQMLVEGEWVPVPEETIEYRALEGDTGETRGGHWCGLRAFGNLTYCAILPPSFGTRARGALIRESTTYKSPYRVLGSSPSNRKDK